MCPSCGYDDLEAIRDARAEERERCAKIADNYAASCKRGSSMSSMAEDTWGYVHATEIAKLVRKANSDA